MTDPGIVVDASALVAYAHNDMRSFAIDELLRELREDTGGPVHIPFFAVEEAQQILADDTDALTRLESFVTAHGMRLADADMRSAVDAIVAASPLSRGLAQAMLISIADNLSLATYAAGTLEQAGAGMTRVLDLGEVFGAD
ncbi:hypothetical protein Ade02nite_20140 [Paractinoplanes deccanensis]|uniref:PIN domain-containing protein n=1 Tax=Paractinoplanes deccanensis TaxID=113561 RepID=A0ABQ3Y044_9ACTN|nr:hypothetical protein [Actinoplanes deccanensis]GID73373.1 hypothetical protein Ade02nite_20140 [Actinoplanes deccanensis]